MMLTLRQTISRALVQYYLALKLSAGAISPIYVTQVESDPAPIVRPYSRDGAGLWDPREVVSVGRASAIVTASLRDPVGSSESLIRHN